MKRLLSTFLLMLCVFILSAQDGQVQTMTFKFVRGNDAFFVPYAGNGIELSRLYDVVETYKEDICSGKMPIHVDAYCASEATRRENLNLAKIRANRVKSELIINKGLHEDCFITSNIAERYEGKSDVVIVTIRVVVQKEKSVSSKQEIVQQDVLVPVLEHETENVELSEEQEEVIPIAKESVQTEQLTILEGSAPALKGVITAEHSKSPIVGAKIRLANQDISTTTNAQGEFSLQLLQPIDEEVIISASGFLTQVKVVKLSDNQVNDLGTVLLKSDIETEMKQEILVQLSESDISDDGQSQNMSTSLSRRGDVFSNLTSYAFSPMRFRVRGYGQENEQVYINGVNFNSQERGVFSYSMIGGLNDATRNRDVTNGIEANSVAYGGVGNTTNILSTASRVAAGWKVGLSGTNRNYKGRVYATYGTGVMQNGWAIAASLAYRYSPYIDTKTPIIGEGIFYNSGGYYFSAEKIFNDNHKLAITTFGSPTRRAQSAGVTQEVYDLYGSIYYNAYWGYQNGQVRNSRIVESFDPTAILNYEWKINDKHSVKINEAFHYSLYSNSALTFYNAPDPRPDYYRNLPSFLFDNQIDENGNFITKDMNGVALGDNQEYTNGDYSVQFGPSVDYETYKQIADLWRERDPETTQINWDELYRSNYANNAINPEGSAKYILERRHNDIWENMFNALYTGNPIDHLKITAGIDTKVSQGKHYKTVEDLLGANQWIDVDPFAERDMSDLAQNVGMTQQEIEMVKQNDINNPNKAVKDGDVFGYNYDINMFSASAFIQNEWNFNQIDFYYAAKATYSQFYRVGHMENGRAIYLQSVYNQRYPDFGADKLAILYNSLGKGQLHWFLDPSFKAGLTYKIDGRNRIKVNALAESRAPLARNAYISQRIHDRTIDGLQSSKTLSYDLTYEFNYGIVRGRVTGFRTHFVNGTELNGYYDDGYRTFVNQAMTGINTIHQGGEAALAVKLGTYFTLSGAASIMDAHYTSDAYSVTSAENGMSLASDINNNPIYELRDSVLTKGLKVANGPQLATSLKLSFFHPKMWFADITVSYFDWNYLDFSPSRRMQGLFTGVRADGSPVNGTYRLETDAEGNTVYDNNGHPVVAYPHSVLSNQESLVANEWYNRFLVDLSVGKLIYLPKRQSLSINLSVSNLLNNTHMKTGGYQQGRIPVSSVQGEGFNGSNKIQKVEIANNVWKFPAKYYYAWGANFFLNLTYKF